MVGDIKCFSRAINICLNYEIEVIYFRDYWTHHTISNKTTLRITRIHDVRFNIKFVGRCSNLIIMCVLNCYLDRLVINSIVLINTTGLKSNWKWKLYLWIRTVERIDEKDIEVVTHCILSAYTTLLRIFRDWVHSSLVFIILNFIKLL